MVEFYRQLGLDDLSDYFRVLSAAYKTDAEYDISFSAMTATLEDEREWLQENPTYGWFVREKIVSAISLRMPWSRHPGPESVPHIGQVITDPEHMHRGYATKLMLAVENDVLREQLKVPFVTLGTAESHPWLRQMYEKLGFEVYAEKQLTGKRHRTLYLKKICNNFEK